MNEWLSLNPDTLLQLGQEAGHAVLPTGLSTYDFPEAVRSYQDQRTKRLLIEFKYVDDEPWSLTPFTGPVALRIGRNSKRLLGIELDVSKSHEGTAGRETLLDGIHQAISGLTAAGGATPRDGNYALVDRVIGNLGRNLLASTTGQ